MVPPPVSESGTDFLGKNNRTQLPTFSKFRRKQLRNAAKSLGLNGEADALLCASQ
jgi:hypothetical protein